jgi:tRNA A37 threonylcarbamoyladenosine dehydratase
MNDTHWLSRTELLIGKESLDKLKSAHILVAGLGGVGSYSADAICRAGVGKMTIADSDRISPSNKNRQLLALTSTEGKSKSELMANRLLDINPELELKVFKEYLIAEEIPAILNIGFDYVIDAIDTLAPKIFFIKNCLEKKISLVSSMGAGGRYDPLQVKVADIDQSYGCQFAQVVRKKLHGLGINTGFKVVYSAEPVSKKAMMVTDDSPNKKSTVGTISYMPAVFGLIAASVVIRDLINE